MSSKPSPVASAVCCTMMLANSPRPEDLLRMVGTLLVAVLLLAAGYAATRAPAAGEGFSF